MLATTNEKGGGGGSYGSLLLGEGGHVYLTFFFSAGSLSHLISFCLSFFLLCAGRISLGAVSWYLRLPAFLLNIIDR